MPRNHAQNDAFGHPTEEEARKLSDMSISRPASVWPGPLTAAKLAYDQAVHHASKRLDAEYTANESKLHGITRRMDDQKQLFYSAVFAKHRQRCMEIYATNSLLRERESRKAALRGLLTREEEECPRMV